MDDLEICMVGMNAVPGVTLAKGSKQCRCYLCDAPMWLSPHSIKRMAENQGPKYLTACVACLITGRVPKPDGKFTCTRAEMEEDYGDRVKPGELDEILRQAKAAGFEEWKD